MLEVRGLTIRAGTEPLVEDLALDLTTGGLTCLIGPSGCGKSSVVKWLAGVLAQELGGHGTATVGGRNAALPHRDIAYQPQQDTLFPWLTICENARLGLAVRDTTPVADGAAAGTSGTAAPGSADALRSRLDVDAELLGLREALEDVERHRFYVFPN